MRFSLRGLLSVVTSAAICIVALLNANYFVAAALRTSVGMALALAIVAAIYVSGKWRAFWVGFAIVGWIHFLSGFWDSVPPFNRGMSQQSEAWLRNLVTSAEMGVTYSGFAGFATVLHCILTALFALLGGYVAMRIDARRQPPVYRAK